MHFPALALVQRGLVSATRGHGAYLLRSVLVAFMLVALWNASQLGRFWGAPGLHVFRWLIFANFVFIALIGIGTFATVVTEEKENRTLGLLQLASFGGMSILAGKSIGQLLAMALMLLVQVPFALLAFTLGGVTRYQIAAAWVVLGAHLLFVYALALLCSVVAPRSGVAARITGLLLLAYYLLPLAGKWLCSVGSVVFQLSSGLQATSALSALQATTATGYRVGLFPVPVLVTLALAAVLFALAGLLFPRCTGDDRPSAPSRAIVADWVLGRDASLRTRGQPLAWKDFHFALGGPVGLVVRCACYGILLVALGLISNQGYGGRDAFGELTMKVMLLVLLLDLGTQSSRVFREEIKWGTLPLLMLLPMPLHHWAYAKVAACAAIALPAALGIALGAYLAPPTAGSLWREAQSHGGLYLLGLVVVGLHLTVWLSLHLQRGAFAMAALLVFLGHTLVSLMLMRLPGISVAMNGLGASLLCLAVIMHPVTARALRRKAAE